MLFEECSAMNAVRNAALICNVVCGAELFGSMCRACAFMFGEERKREKINWERKKNASVYCCSRRVIMVKDNIRVKLTENVESNNVI